ncbi:hypothetical protein OAB00_00155 [Akkermansiaceae bacterium]|nr:hypothetical protein [Akkermansiaceae bacterium]
MKFILYAIFAVVITFLAACNNTGAVKEASGYPVYKFINLGVIDEEALKTDEKNTRELL